MRQKITPRDMNTYMICNRSRTRLTEGIRHPHSWIATSRPWYTLLASAAYETVWRRTVQARSGLRTCRHGISATSTYTMTYLAPRHTLLRVLRVLTIDHDMPYTVAYLTHDIAR